MDSITGRCHILRVQTAKCHSEFCHCRLIPWLVGCTSCCQNTWHGVAVWLSLIGIGIPKNWGSVPSFHFCSHRQSSWNYCWYCFAEPVMDWYYYKWNLLCDYTVCRFTVWGLATLMTLLLVKKLDANWETNNNNNNSQNIKIVMIFKWLWSPGKCLKFWILMNF